MSDPIGGSIDDSAVIRALGNITPNARRAVRTAIGILTIRLQRKTVQEKLSGQVLNVRTGTLRRSINQVVVNENGGKISGIVSTNLKYAPPHEYGFKGPVQVKAHLRLVREAFGRKLKSPVWANVGAHSAQMNLPERSFLRSALREMEASGVIGTEIDAAMDGAIR